MIVRGADSRGRSIVALLCRTSDRDREAAAGTRELAELLGARIIGSPGEPRDGSWEADLHDARGCLLEAGGQVQDALAAGRVPILLAGDCAVAVATLPIVVRDRPDARILWIDAHGDFNTPETSGSQYLGGMGLAGACGLWDTGFGAGVEPARVIMHGVRDLDGPERVALDRTGVHRVEDPAQLAGLELYVHLDLDVLDPDAFPSAFPAAGGLTPDGLRGFLAAAVAAGTLIGAEITAAAPGHGAIVAQAIAPLLASPRATR